MIWLLSSPAFIEHQSKTHSNYPNQTRTFPLQSKISRAQQITDNIKPFIISIQGHISNNNKITKSQKRKKKKNNEEPNIKQDLANKKI